MNPYRLKYYLFGLLTLLLSGVPAIASAQPPVNPPEDFVKASVVITTPGDALYSCTGHTFFRMQCPSQDMDYCFSYESEAISNRVLAFLGGKLKQGMTAIPTAEFIDSYRREGRGVTEYPLNLPIRVKQNLWRVLDNHVDEGMDLPYDYIERGCAISVLHILEEALGGDRMEVNALPEIFSLSRRQIIISETDHAPWTRMMLQVLTNGSANSEVELKEKAITPTTLVLLLQNSHIGGSPVLSGIANELSHADSIPRSGWLSPMVFAIFVLILTALCIVTGNKAMLWILLSIQTLLGLVNVYLVFFSSLCATEWSWLLIPFNPLPLIFWKWRRVWEVPYAALMGVWCVVMLIVGNGLTDPALILLAFSTAAAFTADRLLPDGIKLPAVAKNGGNGNKMSSILLKLKTIHL